MSDDLAKRAIACRHWRWMPGMLCLCDERRPLRLAVEVEWEPGRPVGCVWWGYEHGVDSRAARCLQGDVLLDLTDPATLGCLLALVREAWGRPGVVCTCLPSDAFGWLCCGEYGPTEAEALVAALEAAEGREVSDER